jgi:hypothetical protein
MRGLPGDSENGETVLDMPGAVENTRELASRIGIDDVVTCEAGDALKDDLASVRSIPCSRATSFIVRVLVPAVGQRQEKK